MGGIDNAEYLQRSRATPLMASTFSNVSIGALDHNGGDLKRRNVGANLTWLGWICDVEDLQSCSTGCHVEIISGGSYVLHRVG
jgi:hypothetical protein